jgi:signal transduction histidine kinase
MKNLIKIFWILIILSLCCVHVNASNATMTHSDKSKVIAVVKKAENYIKKYGIEKAIINFRKNSDDIFIGDYKGIFYVSPLHPELIGSNQFNYKDPSGVLVVQEEIEKAKTGGGWLKGRWRKNPQAGKYQCRRIYILPVSSNYFIGSWYHYSPNKQRACLI